MPYLCTKYLLRCTIGQRHIIIIIMPTYYMYITKYMKSVSSILKFFDILIALIHSEINMQRKLMVIYKGAFESSHNAMRYICKNKTKLSKLKYVLSSMVFVVSTHMANQNCFLVGSGVFTLQDFQKGDFLLEYNGELLSSSEAKRKFKSYSPSQGSFQFDFKYREKTLW